MGRLRSPRRRGALCEALETRRLLTAGGLDPSFGAAGWAPLQSQTPVIVYAVAPAPGGKVVAVGRSEPDWRLYVERRNADGTPDASFGGGNGWELLSVVDGSAAGAEGRSVRALSDGSLLIGGTVGTRLLMLARLNSDGTPDASFGGGNGVASVPNGGFARGGALALLPDGSALVAGTIITTPVSPSLFGVAHFFADGTADPAFGTYGMVTRRAGSGDDVVTGIAVDAAGRIVLGGYVEEPGDPRVHWRPVMLRLLGDGSADPSFGDDGVRLTDPTGQGARITDMLLDDQGNIVLTGTFFVLLPGQTQPRRTIGIARYLPDGTPDASFDGDGLSLINPEAAFGEASALALQPDGKLLVAGRAPLANRDGVLLARVNPDGSPDASFGSGGVETVGYGDATTTYTTDMTLAPDGRIFVSASLSAADPYTQPLVARFLGDKPQPTPASVVGRSVFYNDSSFDDDASLPNPGDGPDDNAIATDKAALLPGQAASFANVTSFNKGINGVMVDMANLPTGATLTAADFLFRSRRDNAPAFSGGPSTVQVIVRPGEGVNHSDRVALVWPNYNPASGSIAAQAVANGWLEVTVKADANTGLVAPDVFYFGNLIGETGDGGAAAILRVSALDLGVVKRALNTIAPITSPADFNRDGRVNALDLGIVKQNLNRTLTPPEPAPLPPADASATSTRRVADDLLS